MWPDLMQEAVRRTGGGRFYRCAFQVNPFEYFGRHGKTPPALDETSYNKLIEACLAEEVEVIAITDHYRVKTADTLAKAARDAGIAVFPAFEAVSKDGVHLLCLFEQTKTAQELERILGACGIHNGEDPSPVGKFTVEELLTASEDWGGVCIAAHVAGKGGLLKVLSGPARIAAWKSAALHACSLPGPVADAPADLRPILENKNPQYKRRQPVAIVNASDAGSPHALTRGATSCWVKMSEVSIEGLRQAFLDPRSRIRLTSDPLPDPHSEFVAMTWEGGFLDGAAIRFNENLNVLIGGRGAGKSTIVESVRFVLGLEPLGDESAKAHAGIVRNVLRDGTKVSLLIRSHRPAPSEYLIERTVPNPPVIRTAAGGTSDLRPTDILPGIEVYGQHEISELAKSPEKLTRLLDRFVERDSSSSAQKTELRADLKRSRTRLIEVEGELVQIDEKLAALPGLEEKLARFKEAGVEDQLHDRSVLVTEERVLRTASRKLEPFAAITGDLRKRLPIDLSFLSANALRELPAEQTLMSLLPVLQRLGKDLHGVVEAIDEALQRAQEGIDATTKVWEQRRDHVEAEYEKTLRKLQETKIEGGQFIDLRRQIEELRPLGERKSELESEQKELEDHRRGLLTSWEDAKTEEFRRLDRAAAKVSRKLKGRVRVRVAYAGDRRPLAELLKRRIKGRLSEAIESLLTKDDLSLPELSEAWRSGPAELEKKFRIPTAQAQKLGQASREIVMEVEELELAPTTAIELNVGSSDRDPVWQLLDDLSTGQKATAVLLLLLLEAEAPLVVDQPEDDLDNRFITEGIVPKMREEKRRRQFVFATHNANIPHWVTQN